MSWITETISWLKGFINAPAALIFIGVIISAIGALWASSEQTKSERELRRKSEEIAKLNREIVASVTGGDSFCYLIELLGDPNRPFRCVNHQGQYPLYDVTIRISDLDKLEALKGDLTLEKIAQTETYLKVGNLGPGQGRFMGMWELADTDQKRYNIFISARNGFFTQLLRFRRVKGRWVRATKVYRESEEEKVLLEKIQPEFPRDESGQVQW